MTHRAGRIVTFSGIDGAGKSTQIDWLCKHLSERGLRVVRVTFWDDIAVLAQLRARVSLRTLRNNSSPDISLRHDKNVCTWYLTLVRSFFYLLDSLRLRRVAQRLKSHDLDYIIFDRYIYDQIVQVRARHWIARGFIRLLIAIAPTPDTGFIVDASPERAFSRKPEYPLAFMHEYRRAFLATRDFARALIVVRPGSIAEVQEQIVSHLSHTCSEIGDLKPFPDSGRGVNLTADPQ